MERPRADETLNLHGVEDAHHGRWAPLDGGFYFAERNGPRRALMLLDFSTGVRSEVLPLDKPWDVFALAVSRDRRSTARPVSMTTI